MPFAMFDDVNLNLIPPTAKAVAGYVGGRWPTYKELPKRFPAAKHLSIAVNADEDAECLDVEPGDAQNFQAAAWVRRQQARGVKKPVVYTSVSNAAELLKSLDASGIKRSDVRLWTAHYSFRPHRCSSDCGFMLRTTADATQWTDRSHGRSLDESLCASGFLTEPKKVAARKKVLRAWILAKHAKHWTWARLKSSANWREWKRLGGK